MIIENDGKKSARNTGIISGNILYRLQYWRLGDKKIKEYIKNGEKQ